MSCDPLRDLPLHLIAHAALGVVGGTPTLDQVLTSGSVSAQAMDVGFLAINLGTDPTGTEMLNITIDAATTGGIVLKAAAAPTAGIFLMRNSGSENVLSVTNVFALEKGNVANSLNRRPFEGISKTGDSGIAIPAFRWDRDGLATFHTDWTNSGTVIAQLDSGGVLYHGLLSGGDNYIYEGLTGVVTTGTWEFDSTVQLDGAVTLNSTSQFNGAPTLANDVRLNLGAVANTYFVKDSAGATVDFFVGGSEVFNSDGTTFAVVDNATFGGTFIANGTAEFNSTSQFDGTSAINANMTFADSVEARFGTGNDFRLYHDGTNSRLVSNTPNSATAEGLRTTWQSGVARTSINGAATVQAWYWGDDVAAESRSLALYPSKVITSGLKGNALILTLDTVSGSVIGQIGMELAGSGFTGISREGSALKIRNAGVAVASFSTTAGFMEEITRLQGLSGGTPNIRYDGRVGTANGRINHWMTQRDVQTPVAGSTCRLVAVDHFSTGSVFISRFSVFESGGVGIPDFDATWTDNKLYFNVTGTEGTVAKGNVWIGYDGVGSTLDCTVGGNELWNASSTRFSVVGELAIPVKADATRGAAGTAGRLIFNTDDGNLNVDDGTNWIHVVDGTTA